jgi:hypothetical protein
VKDKQQTIIKQQPSVITLKKIGVAMLITVAALSVTMQFSASKKVKNYSMQINRKQRGYCHAKDERDRFLLHSYCSMWSWFSPSLLF